LVENVTEFDDIISNVAKEGFIRFKPFDETGQVWINPDYLYDGKYLILIPLFLLGGKLD